MRDTLQQNRHAFTVMWLISGQACIDQYVVNFVSGNSRNYYVQISVHVFLAYSRGMQLVRRFGLSIFL